MGRWSSCDGRVRRKGFPQFLIKWCGVPTEITSSIHFFFEVLKIMNVFRDESSHTLKILTFLNFFKKHNSKQQTSPK